MTHRSNGKAVFVDKGDDGDHHKIMAKGKGFANIIYSTKETPVNTADDVDIKFAKANEPFPP